MNIVKKVLDYLKESVVSIKDFVLENTTKEFREALKELARIGLLASIAVVLEGVYAGHFDPKTAVVAGIVAILKAIDKYLHVQGKEENDPSKTLGLTRF